MIPEAKALQEVYQVFYRPERWCGCSEEHPFPHNVDSNGRPAVCLAHEWERQTQLFQRLLVNKNLSLPIPPDVRWNDRTDSFVEQAKERLYNNPAVSPSKIVARNISDDGSVATNLAWYLSQMEWDGQIAKLQHIVVYLDRSTVITRTFQDKGESMRDMLAYAPVLVYWDNMDSRNGTWIKNAIRSRPHGLAFVVK